MQMIYPVIIHPKGKEGYHWVEVPALELDTQGKDLKDCVYMALDVICLRGTQLQDQGKAIPQPARLDPPHGPGDIVTLVDVDFDAYRRMNDMRTVRKNVTLPNYLNEMAMKAGLNFSQVLQEGLKERLGML